MDYEIIYKLSEDHIDDLLALYRHENWSKNRNAEDVKKMLASSWIIAFTDRSSNKLIAFARVVTDYVYRAFIYDVIVEKGYRGLGLGKMIVDNIIDHDDLKNVERIELNCIDSNVAFYKKLGFDLVPKGTNMMRYYGSKI